MSHKRIVVHHGAEIILERNQKRTVIYVALASRIFSPHPNPIGGHRRLCQPNELVEEAGQHISGLDLHKRIPIPTRLLVEEAHGMGWQRREVKILNVGSPISWLTTNGFWQPLPMLTCWLRPFTRPTVE
jgi:hypothetical protein